MSRLDLLMYDSCFHDLYAIRRIDRTIVVLGHRSRFQELMNRNGSSDEVTNLITLSD